MTTTDFDALKAAREELATKADLHRALWVQGAAIVGTVGALFALAALTFAIVRVVIGD